MQLTQVALQSQQVKMAGFDLMSFVQGEILPLFEIQDASKYFSNPTQQPTVGQMDATGNVQDPMANVNLPKMSESIPTSMDIEANANNPMM